MLGVASANGAICRRTWRSMSVKGALERESVRTARRPTWSNYTAHGHGLGELRLTAKSVPSHTTSTAACITCGQHDGRRLHYFIEASSSKSEDASCGTSFRRQDGRLVSMPVSHIVPPPVLFSLHTGRGIYTQCTSGTYSCTRLHPRASHAGSARFGS
jgi:hypothetical protein